MKRIFQLFEFISLNHKIYYSLFQYQCYFCRCFNKKNGTKWLTDFFTKDTNSHQYLHATSCHPPNCKSIPYGQVICIKRICSDANQLKTRLNSLSDWLVNRGYKKEVIFMKEIHRVDAIERESLLLKHRKQYKRETLTLREKCPYSEFFWSECGKIRTRKLRIRTLFTQCDASINLSPCVKKCL